MILSLSTLPCCAEEDHCDEEIQLCENEKENSSEHEESEPPCSPFFSCGSCTGFNLTTIHFSKIDPPIVMSAQRKNGADAGMPQSFQTSILKPPRRI
jgi:hypothetical protein